MTKPTYEELDSIDMDAKAIANQNQIGTPFAWRKAYPAALADAVLAKWGAPQAGVGGQPVSMSELALRGPPCHQSTLAESAMRFSIALQPLPRSPPRRRPGWCR